MVTEKMLLRYIRDNSPVPYSYIHRRFPTKGLSMQLWRLRKQGLIKRVVPAGEGPLWIVTKDGGRRLGYYEQQEGAGIGARSQAG